MSVPDRSHALDNIVVVLFENRSFDNVLGHLYGPRTVRTSTGLRQGPEQPYSGVGGARPRAQGGSVHGRHRPGLAEPGLG